MKHHTSFSLLSVALGLSVALLSACATPAGKPAFYPNAHYQHMGPAKAQAEAQACADLATQSEVGAINKIDTARAGAAGAAGVATAGVIGSLLSGQKPDLQSITAGAAAIGAGGAAATAAGQAVGGGGMYREFVQQCLAERGYQVIGWH